MFKVEHIGIGMYEVLQDGTRIAVFNTTDRQGARVNAESFVASLEPAPIAPIPNTADLDRAVADSVLRAVENGHPLGGFFLR